MPRKPGGNAAYLADLSIEGTLHAKIISLRIPDMPEGYTVVDRSDVPGSNRVKIITDDQPFFAEGAVNYIGEPILLVAGPGGVFRPIRDRKGVR